MHSLVHSPTHSLTHPFTHSLIHLYTRISLKSSVRLTFFFAAGRNMDDASDVASEVGSAADDVAGPVEIAVARRIHGPTVKFCEVGIWCGWRPIKPGRADLKLVCILCKIDCQAQSLLLSSHDGDEYLGLVPWPMRIHSAAKLIRKHKGKVCMPCCTVFRLYSQLGYTVVASRVITHMHTHTRTHAHTRTHTRTRSENARRPRASRLKHAK